MAETFTLLTRDADFYVDDGNAILLVESTLFKVHRSMLMKDESIFHLMFTAKHGQDDHTTEFSMDSIQAIADEDDEDEGQSDHSPIRLPDVTVNEFRALLWSLYALPAELVTSAQTRAEVDRFIDLATVSHRFQFVSMEQWSLQTLEAFHAPTNPDYEPSILARLTAVSVLCDRKALLDVVVARWKRLIGEGRELGLAIEVAERHSMDDLLALAYLSLLRKGREHWPEDKRHRIRLLNGFYGLVTACTDLPRKSPPIAHPPSCTAQPKCGETWRKFWKHIICGDVSGKLAKAAQLWRYDMPGLLMVAQSVVQAVVEETIPEHGGLGHMPKECRLRALEATKNRVMDEQARLKSYFCDL